MRNSRFRCQFLLAATLTILGHQSLSTTQVYTHLSTQRLRAAYDDAHPRAEAG